MFADGLRCTHNGTGGPGAFTLASRGDGYPQPIDAFGTSGSLVVEYQIAEYSDATLATLVREESGLGVLNLATNVLTRTTVLKTWVAGGSYNKSNPSALSFGATAANIVITFGGGANTQKAALPATFNVTSSSSDIWQPFNTRVTYDSASGVFAMSAGARLYIPIEYVYGKPIVQVAVDVTTAVASSTLRMGIYDTDQSSGGPGNLLTEFTAAAQIDTSATGLRAVTPATPFGMPAGFPWLCLQASAAISLRRLSHFGHGLLSTGAGGGRDQLMFDKGATYGALPATADTSASNVYTRSSGGQVVGLFK
jgi:hypothetical protein